MKIGSKKDIKKDHKELSITPREPSRAEDAAHKINKPIKDHLGAQQEQINNQRMLSEKHNEEEVAITIYIVGTGLVTYQFW